jgi:hypothetical protein
VDPLAELAARWQAAEERLYPALLFDEQRYEQAMLVLRAAIDELSTCATADDLVAADQRRGEIVQQAARRAGVELVGVDPHQLAAAALRQRLAAIRDQQRRRQAAAAITTTRQRGGGWATLHERGGPPPQPPYEWLAVSVPAFLAAMGTVAGVHAWITLDVDSDAARFEATPVTVELADGEPASAARPSTEPETHDALSPWQDAITRLQHNIAPGGDVDRHR